jgi:hypothetical protein
VTSEKFDRIFSTVENDIKSRFKRITEEINHLKNELIQITRDYKNHLKLKTLHELELNENFYEKSLLTKKKTNESLIKTNIYKCEEYLKELNSFHANFEKKLDNIKFESNDWLPDSSIYGKFFGLNLDKFLLKLISNKAKLCNIEDKSVNGICALPNKTLLATCIDSNELFVIDENLSSIRKIVNLGLNCPLGVCTNNIDSIYVCDALNHRVLILDMNFNLVKAVGSLGKNYCQFNRPVDIAYHNGSVYVLDCLNNRIQELTSDCVFKREIAFSSLNLKRPVRLDITDNMIALNDNYEKVLLFSFYGELKQVLTNVRLMCFFDTHLFTCDDSGQMSCYERYYNNNDRYVFLFKRTINHLKSSISFMKYFNGHLVVSLGRSKKGLAVY